MLQGNQISNAGSGPIHYPLRGASYCWEQSLCDLPPSQLQQTGRQLNDRSNSPLGMTLYAPESYTQELVSGPFSSRHLIDGLIRELQLRAPVFKNRHIPWLSWQLPHNLLDAADATEVMYSLGRLFRLGESDKAHYNAHFQSTDFTETRAALFKGLGFNAIEINLDSADQLTPTELKRLISLSHDYHYQHFGLSLNFPDANLPKKILRHLHDSDPKPDTITLQAQDPKNRQEREFSEFFHAMRDLGYRVLGNDCFVSPSSPLASAQNNHHLRLNLQGYNCQNVSDIVGVGPGSAGHYGNMIDSTPKDLQAYLSYSFNPGTDNNSDPRLKLVTDQLLCYHKLDLKYFHDRYSLDMKTLLQKVWEPLQVGSGQTSYHIHQNQLTLTPTGILQLSPLCQSLIDHFPSAIR